VLSSAGMSTPHPRQRRDATTEPRVAAFIQSG
jgi:hypothetical protein